MIGSLTETYPKAPIIITFEYTNNQIGSTIPATPLTPATPVPDTSTPTPTTPGQPVEVKYVKQPRYKASVFTVNKAIKNAQGRWRYKVAGGYITAN